ncbi:MAG: bacteriohemerythrin [Treponema sp.]|jgi:hemerythrin|nr:bacteriohemerythrin [Treponema sp.]
MGYHVIEWNSHYSVGIESIDEQHKQIISMCNNLCLNCYKKESFFQDFFRQGLSGLFSFLRYHFTAEEQMLDSVNFPDILTHKEEHNRYVNFFNGYLSYLGTDDEKVLKESMPAIQDRLLTHISNYDHGYANYIHTLKRHGSWYLRDGHLPTEAFLG